MAGVGEQRGGICEKARAGLHQHEQEIDRQRHAVGARAGIGVGMGVIVMGMATVHGPRERRAGGEVKIVWREG